MLLLYSLQFETNEHKTKEHIKSSKPAWLNRNDNKQTKQYLPFNNTLKIILAFARNEPIHQVPRHQGRRQVQFEKPMKIP